jgi:hypothetical protein
MTMPAHSFLERVPERLRKVLVRATPEVLARAELFLAQAAAPCVYFQSARVSERPLRRGLVGRLLGKQVAEPKLPVLQSKFGGVPYVTAADLPLMKDRRFLLQINLAEVASLPQPLPRQGLFCVDMPASGRYFRWFAVRFYTEPSEALAVLPPTPIRCVGKYEAAMRFMPGMSYDADEWDTVFPDEDGDFQEAWAECNGEVDTMIGDARPSRGALHCLSGHRGVRDADTDLRPPDGYPPNQRDYEQLLRLDCDNGAGFAWGSNVVYIYIHRDDLAAGRLGRAFDTPANY